MTDYFQVNHSFYLVFYSALYSAISGYLAIGVNLAS